MTNNIGRKERFVEEVIRDLNAGAGVMIVRTKEPLRAFLTLQDIAIAREYELREWDVIEGWKHYDHAAPDDTPKGDGMVQILPAMREVMDSTGWGPRTLAVMMWPHEPMNNLGPLKQLLMHYANRLPVTYRRLILVVPPHANIVEELKDALVVHDFGVPDHDELIEIYNRSTESIGQEAQRPNIDEAGLHRLADAAAGLTALEAELAFSRAFTTNRENLPGLSVDAICEVVAASKVDAVKRSDVLEIMDPVPMGEIGGLDNLKEWVRTTHQCMTPEAREFGIDAPRGVFLAGPPGTGKSASAKAIASELQLPLIRFDVSRVFNSLVGKSEERIKDAMATIASMAPCVALVDEVDKVFNINSAGGDAGTSTRVLGTLLTGMQENNKGVFWVLTANRVSGLPPELLRKGRLDENFAVTEPNEEERLEVLMIHLRKRGWDPAEVPGLEAAAASSADYVPVELEFAVNEALKQAFVTNADVTGELIVAQLRNMRPLKQAFAEQFQQMQEWAENNARPASRHGAAVAAKRARSRTAAATPGRGAKRSLDG